MDPPPPHVSRLLFFLFVRVFWRARERSCLFYERVDTSTSIKKTSTLTYPSIRAQSLYLMRAKKNFQPRKTPDNVTIPYQRTAHPAYYSFASHPPSTLSRTDAQMGHTTSFACSVATFFFLCLAVCRPEPEQLNSAAVCRAQMRVSSYVIVPDRPVRSRCRCRFGL